MQAGGWRKKPLKDNNKWTGFGVVTLVTALFYGIQLSRVSAGVGLLLPISYPDLSSGDHLL